MVSKPGDDMRTIKTRETAKTIKVLDKSVDVSKRMKDAFVRTKVCAEETQNPHGGSPTEYAATSVQGKARGAAEHAASRLRNPQAKARDNIDRAKGHLQEARRQMPKERKRAAEQAQKTASKSKDGAGRLRDAAGQSRASANEAKESVRGAKQSLKQVRLEGRRTLREVKQNARIENKSLKTNSNIASRGDVARPGASGMRGANPSHGGASNNAVKSGASRPNYLRKGANASGSAGDAAKAADKSAKSVKSAAKGFKDTAKGGVKTTKKTVKTAENTARQTVKTAQQGAKAAQKTAQKAAKTAKAAEKAARAAAKAAERTAKASAKAVTAMVKSAIAAIKGLIAVIAAGGWVAIFIILIICMIAMLVGSIFGIFFSSEPAPNTGQSINVVITEINTEYTNQIDAIISSNSHDLLDMSGARASWKQVLAIYTVRTVSDPDNPMEVATMDDGKAAILRDVFWEMNTVSHTTDTFEVEEDVIGEDGLPTGETTTSTQTVLRITVSHKTADEMAAQYGFDAEQKEWLEELLKPEYHSLWNALLYGITSIGDGSMIEVADTQIGNVGGELYWRWYGFPERVEWCAIFVSWCAKQAGYIDSGIIPLFSYCPTGEQLFKERGQWQDNTYTPSPGNIIFFDWEPDGETDHVGIVESVADGMVNTIEGNSSDSVRRRSYELGSVKIYGYGVPEY